MFPAEILLILQKRQGALIIAKRVPILADFRINGPDVPPTHAAFRWVVNKRGRGEILLQRSQEFSLLPPQMAYFQERIGLAKRIALLTQNAPRLFQRSQGVLRIALHCANLNQYVACADAIA